MAEIDIIAIDKNEYVFIEVKTRISNKYGNPIESVNENKIKHIIKAANYYVYKNNLESKNIRFDVIEVYIGKKEKIYSEIKQIIGEKK